MLIEASEWSKSVLVGYKIIKQICYFEKIKFKYISPFQIDCEIDEKSYRIELLGFNIRPYESYYIIDAIFKNNSYEVKISEEDFFVLEGFDKLEKRQKSHMNIRTNEARVLEFNKY